MTFYVTPTRYRYGSSYGWSSVYAYPDTGWWCPVDNTFGGSWQCLDQTIEGFYGHYPYIGKRRAAESGGAGTVPYMYWNVISASGSLSGASWNGGAGSLEWSSASANYRDVIYDGIRTYTQCAGSYPEWNFFSWFDCHVMSASPYSIFAVNTFEEGTAYYTHPTTGNWVQDSTGVFHCQFASNEAPYGQYYDLNTRVSPWNTAYRTCGVWAVSSTQIYIFLLRSGNIYMVRRNHDADTFTSPVQITSGGSNNITKVYTREVGAGQSTKIYLITNDGGKVFVWDYSTEASVSSSFTSTFGTHYCKNLPIVIGSDYYHFHWDHATKVIYRWKYTSSTYANPTITTFATPTDPSGHTYLEYLGASVEFNTSSNELYMVSWWTCRDNGWAPTGVRKIMFKYAEATAATPSWSSDYTANNFPVRATAYTVDFPQEGSNYDGRPYGGDHSVLSAYDRGSNNHYTKIYWTGDNQRYSNPESILTSFHFTVDFWTDGGPFYQDATLTISGAPTLYLEGITDINAEMVIDGGASVIQNESYVSQLTWGSNFYIQTQTFNVDGELALLAPAVLTLDGSLLSEDYVNAEVVIDGSAVLVLDATSGVEVDNEISFHIPYFILGTQYHAQFLEYVNDARYQIGLPPYKIPTPEMYYKWPDIAQLHADNMAATETYAHEGGNLPVDWDTYLERFAVSGMETAGENIWVTLPDDFLNYPIFDDDTIKSPLEAFTGWWNSLGHRANLLKDYESDNIYSWFGIGLGEYPNDLYPDRTFYYAHVMGRYGPEATVMAQKDFSLHVSYDSTGAMIESLNASYDFYAYENVRASHNLKWSIHLAVENIGSYGARVAADHVAPIFYNLSTAHQSPYEGTVNVVQDNQTVYRITNLTPVTMDNEGAYSVRIGLSNAASYSDVPSARSSLVAAYSVPVQISKAHVGFYGDPVPVKKANTTKWSLQLIARASHSGVYELTTPVKADSEADYSILAVNTLRTANKTFYSLSSGDAVIPVTNLVTLTVPEN